MTIVGSWNTALRILSRNTWQFPLLKQNRWQAASCYVLRIGYDWLYSLPRQIASTLEGKKDNATNESLSSFCMFCLVMSCCVMLVHLFCQGRDVIANCRSPAGYLWAWTSTSWTACAKSLLEFRVLLVLSYKRDQKGTYTQTKRSWGANPLFMYSLPENQILPPSNARECPRHFVVSQTWRYDAQCSMHVHTTTS